MWKEEKRGVRIEIVSKGHVLNGSISVRCPEQAAPEQETESRLVISRGWGRREWGVTAVGYGVSFGGDIF